MAALFRWIVGWLVWLSAEPAQLDVERPKAAAAVAAAASCGCTHAPEPAPGPAPKPAECCGECNGTGYLTMPDGHKVKCPCPPNCKCLKQPTPAKAECPDGKCPAPARK